MKLNVFKKYLWPLTDGQLLEMLDVHERGIVPLYAVTVDRIVDIFRQRSLRIERLIRRAH